MKNGHRTIGLLVSGIMDQFTESLCRGAMKACRNNDVDLMVFPGKYIDRDLSGQPEIMYEYQYNTIFEYAKSGQLDGLIVSAGNIGCFAGDERVREMLQGYGDIPTILVASKWDGYISVNYDNQSGVREGLEYLIDKMHCERFAMIGGPDGNTDARERKEIFVKVMEERGIPVNEQMFAYGSLDRDNPDECNLVLDNNPDVEAIFCVNDDTALGLYDIMRKRGLTPGKDIKVFGYDNTITGSKAQPSLSTVGSDAIYLGERVVLTMCEYLDGKTVESVVLPAKFVRRNSLGETFTEAEVGKLSEEIDTDRFFDEIFYRYANSNNEEGVRLRHVFKTLTEQLIYLAGHPDEKDVYKKRLMKNIDKFLDYNALEYADMDDLLLHIERVYEMACANTDDKNWKYEMRIVVDDIYQKIIHNMDFRAGNVRAERLDEVNDMKIFVKDSLNFRRGNDAAYAALLECVSWLKVKNAYLYTFEEPIAHLYREEFVRPENVLLKAYLHEGVLSTVPVNSQRMPVTNIFDNEFAKDSRCDFVLLPLFYSEMQYGLLLCDLTDSMFGNGEFLTNQLGAAVHMVELLKENELIQQRLEEMNTSLRENNIALDHLSKQDALTGIHNRRGYMDEAKELLAENKLSGQDTLVAYVDMNNLKVINDRYGHEDGDFSLKMISDVLKELTEEQGVVGRIGGDEYSFVLTMYNNMDEDSLERRIHAMFAARNRRSDKPYNVTVSVGLYKVESGSAVELEDALSFADEKLYVAKQNKVRTVEK